MTNPYNTLITNLSPNPHKNAKNLPGLYQQ